MTQNNLFLLGICFLLGWQSAQSQTEQSRLEILHADALRKGKGYDRLLDSVVMKHKNSLIYCDSAHFYGQDQLAKLFGNVKIENQEDSVTVTSRYAEYDGETQLAKLRTNVVLVNEGTTLYTDFLDYNRETGVANYYNTGMVKDSINTLTSQRGVYETRDEKITFRDKVVLENPDYTMKSKILYYYTLTKIAETEKLTNILSKEGDKLNAQRGSVYDTENKIFRFYDGNVESENSVVSGEILYYDENAQYFEARENVSIFNKEQNVEVFGEEGKYWEDLQYSRVYGRALVRKYFEADTLFMIADTLVTQDSDVPEERYMLAYPDMRMIKSTLAGRADSMAYTYADSTVYLFSDPVLWNNKSQITADSIRFLLANEEIDRALLVDNAFAITRDTVANFNQIKGRKMTSYFAEGDIELLDVEGNGESLYFALENDTTFKGLNKLLCGRIIMEFQEGTVSRISHSIKPEASFTPPHLIEVDQKQLKGFTWRSEERPDRQRIDDWRTPKRREKKPYSYFDEPDVTLPLPDEDELQKRIDNFY
ncbi:OstA-like protein [Cyclobacterium xiamenense]|uniref:OstA-like protein n=1 Tax=Cyclobacterium xiamenense TaxID=1297121 RepID=UPI0012B7EF7A|nr:OstA-like protein [Cyclobacterium xiamenense]